MTKVKIQQKHIKTFKECLDHNDKIFLSAIFGKGKTTFLNHFFDKENYFTVVLNPVLYSVHSNDDVFKLLEFDIAYEVFLQLEEDYLEKYKIPKIWYLQQVLRNKGVSLGEIMMEHLEKTNKKLHSRIITVVKIFNEAKDIPKEYQDFKNYDSVKWDQEISKLLNECPERGNIFNNITSEYLSKLTDKTKVLIIDDLDRMDPGHIFRLLNVFSNSFFEDFNGERVHQRLGFDKIILVGSHATIRGIYEHVYGQNSNFNGYFKKFYDEIFVFDPKIEAINFLDTHLKVHNDFNDPDVEAASLLWIKQILLLFFEHNLISWRHLQRVVGRNISREVLPNKFATSNISELIVVPYYLTMITQTYEHLLKCLVYFIENEVIYPRDSFESQKRKSYFFSKLIPILSGMTVFEQAIRADSKNNKSINIGKVKDYLGDEYDLLAVVKNKGMSDKLYECELTYSTPRLTMRIDIGSLKFFNLFEILYNYLITNHKSTLYEN